MFGAIFEVSEMRCRCEMGHPLDSERVVKVDKVGKIFISYISLLYVANLPSFFHLLRHIYDNRENPKGGYNTCRCPLQGQVASVVKIPRRCQRQEQISLGSPS